jgi:hypothetical protein
MISEAVKVKPNLGGAGYNRPVVSVVWTPALKKINNRYPSALKSKKWAEIVKLVNSDQVELAMDLARTTENSPEIKFRNTLTRRTRVERTAWFTRMAQGDRELRALFTTFADRIAPYIEKNATSIGNIARINIRVHEMVTELRVNLRSWLNRLVRDTAKIALRAKGDALKPIFKNSQEAFEESFGCTLETILEAFQIGEERTLSEATKPKLATIYIKTGLASISPAIKSSSLKWKGVQKKVLKTILKKNITGLNPSTRIWDITQSVEQTLKRTIATEIAKGTSSNKIARNIKIYVNPTKLAPVDTGALGPGVYKSAYKNARRLAVTETNRAYAKASGEFAKAKPWIIGKEFHLSGSHKMSDECDSWDGQIVSVDEYNDMVDSGQFPFHPHCMCYDTDVIDENYLDKSEITDEEEAA